MTMPQVNIDLTGYDVQEGFDPLPGGWYRARIAGSELKDGSKGQYISWTFEIVGHPNRVWDVMSLGNDVARIRLKTLATCIGHPNPNYINDTDPFHGKECFVKLKVQEDPGYDAKNKMSGFKPLDEKKASPPPPEAAQPASGEQMPWE